MKYLDQIIGAEEQKMRKISIGLFISFLLMVTPASSWAVWGDPILDGLGVTGKISVGGGTLEIPNSTTLPPTCVVGEIYMDTNAASGQRCYLCESTNVWVLQGNGFGSPTELTMVNGRVVVSGIDPWRFHSIDTGGDAATDNLYNIVGGNPGEIIMLQAENDARTVVVKDLVNLKLQGDFSLDNDRKKIMLICISSGVWHEVSRAVNS